MHGRQRNRLRLRLEWEIGENRHHQEESRGREPREVSHGRSFGGLVIESETEMGDFSQSQLLRRDEVCEVNLCWKVKCDDPANCARKDSFL